MAEVSGKEKSRKKGSLLGSLCGLIGTVVIIGVLVVAALAFVPHFLGYELYDVLTGSMEPEIPAGSLVVVKKTDVSELSPGDVIAFHRTQDGIVVTHRLQEIDEEQKVLITKGDANEQEDMAPTPYLNLIGKVKWHIAGIGDFASWLFTMPGKICLFAMLIAGLILSHIASMLKE